MSSDEILVTREEAAERLNVTKRTVDRWRECGWLEEVRIGTHKVMIKLSSIENFLQKSQDRQLSAAS